MYGARYPCRSMAAFEHEWFASECTEIDCTGRRELMMKRKFGGRRRRLLIAGLSSLAIVGLAAGTMVSMALFTDQETDDSTFTTGTIILDSTKVSALNLTTSALMPGDAVSSSVTVENDGTAQLRYAVSQTSTNADSKDLRDSLLLVIRTEDT